MPSIDNAPAFPTTQPPPTSVRGKGVLTVCANLWVPGLGFALAKMWRRAIGWLALTAAITVATVVAISVPRYVPAVIVLAPLSVAASIGLLIDGYVRGHRA